MTTTPLPRRAAWSALERHRRAIETRHLRDLFASDPGRGERFAVEGAGVFLDYSKNRITDETLSLLIDLAESRTCAGGPKRCSRARRST